MTINFDQNYYIGVKIISMKAEELLIKIQKLDWVQLQEKVLKWLSVHVLPSKIRHILRVEKNSEELASDCGQKKIKAQLAGLIYGLTKYFYPNSFLTTLEIRKSRNRLTISSLPSLA